MSLWQAARRGSAAEGSDAYAAQGSDALPADPQEPLSAG